MTDEKKQEDFDTTLTDDLLGDALDEEVTPTEESTDPETETVEADTETETVTEESEETAIEESEEEEAPVVDPDVAVLESHGLGSKYRTVDEALKAVQHQNAQIEQMRYDQYMANRRAAEVAAQPQPAEHPQIDPEALMNDPDAVLAQAGYVRRDEVSHVARQAAMQANDERAYGDFVANTPDFEAMKPAIMAKLQQFPGLNAIPMAEAVKVLYTMAKQDAAPPPKPTVVTERANPGKKERASTSGGKSTAANKQKTQGQLGPGGVPMAEFNKMSVEEIDKHPEYFRDPLDGS